MDLKDCSNNSPQLISLHSVDEGVSYSCLVKDIIYLDRGKDSHYTHVFYKKRFSDSMTAIRVKGTLKEFNEILPNQFQRVNRSIIINLRYVLSYTKDTVQVHMPGFGPLEFSHKYDISHFFIEL